MRFKVYPMRLRGQRMPWRDVRNTPPFVGDLISFCVIGQKTGERFQAIACRDAFPVTGALLPDLYEPVLLGFSPLAFRLRGFERIEDNGYHYAVVQEWHCEQAD